MRFPMSILGTLKPRMISHRARDLLILVLIFLAETEEITIKVINDEHNSKI